MNGIFTVSLPEMILLAKGEYLVEIVPGQITFFERKHPIKVGAAKTTEAPKSVELKSVKAEPAKTGTK